MSKSEVMAAALGLALLGFVVVLGRYEQAKRQLHEMKGVVIDLVVAGRG